MKKVLPVPPGETTRGGMGLWRGSCLHAGEGARSGGPGLGAGGGMVGVVGAGGVVVDVVVGAGG